MARTLPHIQLKGGFGAGEDNWGDHLNANLLKLTAMVQCSVTSTLDVKPDTPTAGVYLLSSIEPTNPKKLAIYENGVWTHFSPIKGMLIFDKNESTFKYYNGTAWAVLPLTSTNLAALGALDSSNGVIEQTGAATFAKRAVGVAAATDILNRSSADTRYSQVGHTHANEVKFTLEEEAATDNAVVYRHAFTKAFSFAGDFAGLVARAESASADYTLTFYLQSAAGEAFATKGTLVVHTDGTVTATTVSNAAFTAPAGSVMKIVAPVTGPTLTGLTVTFLSV